MTPDRSKPCAMISDHNRMACSAAGGLHTFLLVLIGCAVGHVSRFESAACGFPRQNCVVEMLFLSFHLWRSSFAVSFKNRTVLGKDFANGWNKLLVKHGQRMSRVNVVVLFGGGLLTFKDRKEYMIIV